MLFTQKPGTFSQCHGWPVAFVIEIILMNLARSFDLVLHYVYIKVALCPTYKNVALIRLSIHQFSVYLALSALWLIAGSLSFVCLSNLLIFFCLLVSRLQFLFVLISYLFIKQVLHYLDKRRPSCGWGNSLRKG